MCFIASACRIAGFSFELYLCNIKEVCSDKLQLCDLNHTNIEHFFTFFIFLFLLFVQVLVMCYSNVLGNECTQHDHHHFSFYE